MEAVSFFSYYADFGLISYLALNIRGASIHFTGAADINE